MSNTTPNPASPSPAAIIKSMVDGLAAWAVANNVVPIDVDDPFEAQQMAVQRADGGAVITYWDGDAPVAQSVRSVMVRQRVKVVLTAPQSPQSRADGKRPLLARVATLRAVVLALTPDTATTEGFWKYAGAATMKSPNGIPLDAYELTFTLQTTTEVDE